MRSPTRTKAGRLSGGRTNAREAAVLAGFAKQIQTVKWDYSYDGGAVGDFLFNAKLPANAVVTAVMVDEQTAVTGATDMVLSAGSTALTASIDFTGQSGVVEYATLAGGASAIKVSSESELKLTIATNAATAGKVRFAVEFYLSE